MEGRRKEEEGKKELHHCTTTKHSFNGDVMRQEYVTPFPFFRSPLFSSFVVCVAATSYIFLVACIEGATVDVYSVCKANRTSHLLEILESTVDSVKSDLILPASLVKNM